jgi:cation transport regulator ChaC
MRRFNKRFAGRITADETDNVLPPDAELSGIVAQDLVPTEVELEHVPFREALIRNFEILWAKRQVEWLKYPKLRKRLTHTK